MTAGSDDELLGELGSVLRRADPVPHEVTDFAKAALGWRRLDADLAELLADSALDADAASLTRGAASVRALTFRSGEVTIDVEIEDGRLLGQVAPALAVLVELQAEGGTVASSAESDALGRFRLGVEGSGRFRLRVVREGAPPIETSWFTV